MASLLRNPLTAEAVDTALAGVVVERLFLFDLPAPSYLEARLEQVEDGELAAEQLTEVVSRDEARENNWGSARILSDGTLKLQKGGKSEVKPPANSEELRYRLKLMGVAWEFIRLRFPSKGFLQGLSSDVWTDHAEWLLGEEVYGMTVKNHLGEVVFKPAWHTLLAFDYQVRKAAFKLVNVRGHTLVGALRAVRKDAGLHQRYFLTPTAVATGAGAARTAASSASSSLKRPLESTARPAEGFQAPTSASADGGGGPSAKGKGKGNPKRKPTWKKNQNPRTPDGRQKCFKYHKGKCSGGCGRIHACLVCGGPHPLMQCPQKPGKKGEAPERPQGDAAGRQH